MVRKYSKAEELFYQKMPEIKFKHVVSCNSEDKQFPASNLVRPESFKKWKCMPGVEQAIVILQLDHAVKMHTIDIGNFGSAFIEVLAGHSATINDPISANNNESYDLLLACQSFMSPTESRLESYCSRVRLFNSKEHFEAESLDKKYDRIKVICTQPYNKNVGYGLAFIRCCSVDENPPKLVATTNSQNPFLRLTSNVENLDDNLSETNFAPGSLFRNRSRLGRKSEEKPELQSTGRVETAREKKKQKLSKEENVKKKERERIGKEFEIKERNKEDMVKGVKKDDHRKSSDIRKNVKFVPFGRLFSGVTFVLSGFENPYRSELRDKAIEMGAKYQPDWSSNGRCTHLICAFADTPKYNQ
uniref:BRCT domain-containing protein n=1 Tax=Romanomermis culicivorax TaxID=13658 RepID=A0A915I8Z2_ROMCU